MLPIVWRAAARGDLARIIRTISNENTAASRGLKAWLEAAVLPAAEHSYLYRQSDRLPGMREIVAHPNYILIYRVTATCVEVINACIRAARFPDPLLQPRNDPCKKELAK
jgi:toxin ParE1/3/4